MTSLRVLVVGNSVAGPAFASFLLLSSLRSRVKLTVLERAPHVRPEGQNIDLRNVGLDAVRRLGLEESIRAHLTGEKGVRLVDENDSAVASIAASEPGQTQGPTADVEMLRGTLAQLLEAQLERLNRQNSEKGGSPVEFIYDDFVDQLHQQDDEVHITLAKSKAQRVFDIVVGADGLQSRTRRQAFGVEGESERLHKLSIYGGFFSMPRLESDTDWRRWFHAPGSRGIMMRPSDRPDRITVFMHKKTSNMTEDKLFSNAATGFRDAAAQKSILVDCFSDIVWTQKDRVLSELKRSEDFYYDMVAQVKMDTWSIGRVVLIGDSAHCTSPLSGMGTSLALAGAYHLAGALAVYPDDLSTALDMYEKSQRPLVMPAQNLPPAIGLIFDTSTPFWVWFTNRLAGTMAAVGPALKFFVSWVGPGQGQPPSLPDYGFDVPRRDS
ncbi:hypothetical protein PRZ48_005344 [Zasmidium cellare]|uniref:FAD-binding domain-containing protein n=1 Tax=Zasmidium cellare TaxID=395010 RepID=A0ABR0EUC6_ZASCE|nr:hypothetical protein PRZ48_005344 [Zasmidium cellare]